MTRFRGSRSAQIPPDEQEARSAGSRARRGSGRGRSSSPSGRGRRTRARPGRSRCRRARRCGRRRGGGTRARGAAPAATPHACPSSASGPRTTARTASRGRSRPRRRRRSLPAIARRTPPPSRPRSTRSLHFVEPLRAARARCRETSSAGPKWISASRSGARRSISSIVRNQPSTSTSGGGVGGSTSRLGWIRTPAASPA